MPAPRQPARIKPVTRVEPMPEFVAVPKNTAPGADASLFEHALFALKHEPLNVGLLHEALKQVSEAEVVEAITAQRFSAYARRAAFIWETANEKQLALPWATVGGNYLPMFDPWTTTPGQAGSATPACA